MMNRPSNLVAVWEISLGAALLLALTSFVAGTEAKGWWGISSIIYLSPALRWGLLLLAAIAFLVSLLGAFSKLSLPESFRGKVWIVLPILGLGLFALRQAYPLLGDGWLLIGISERPISIPSIWTSDRPWPLSLSFFTLFHRLSGLSGQVTYQLFSVLSGVSFPVLLVWFARRLGFSFWQSILLGVPLLTSGILALFAGYMENYPVLAVLWIAALLYTLVSIQNERIPFWPLIVAAPFLFFWHFGSLVLFPAIVFAGFLRVRKTAMPQRNFLFLLLGLSGFLLVVYLVTPLSQGIKLFLPLSPGYAADGYSLFSGHHIFDFIFEMAIAAPLAPFFLLAVWTLQPVLIRDSGLQVLAVAALFGIATAFVFDPELGMARDWDILTTMLLPLNLLAGYAIVKVQPSATLQGRIVGAGLVSLLVIALPFMLTNHQGEASVERYRDLLSAHPERAAYGWEILANLMGEQGNLEGRLVCFENAAAVSNNQRYWFNVANLAKQLEHWERGRHAATKLRGIVPPKAATAKHFFVLFLSYGLIDEAERMLAFLRELVPSDENLDAYIAALERAKSDSLRRTIHNKGVFPQ